MLKAPTVQEGLAYSVLTEFLLEPSGRVKLYDHDAMLGAERSSVLTLAVMAVRLLATLRYDGAGGE